jgi:hypothetical protein
MSLTYPCCHSCKIGSVNSACIERLAERVSASRRPVARIVMEVLGPRIEAADALLLVAETYSDWLGDVQHIRHIAPRIGVVRCRQVLSEHTRSVLLEQPDERIRTRSAIEPECEGIFSRLVPRLEEPEEDMDLYKAISTSV